MDKKIEELLKAAEEIDRKQAEFARWRFRHPIQYRRWLKTSEGKQYKQMRDIDASGIVF